MAERPKLPDAVSLALKLGFPPTTLALRPGQAAGHRLAKPVSIKGATPDRSFATVHGLAVHSADVVGRGGARQDGEEEEEHEAGGGVQTHKGIELTRHIPLGGAAASGGHGPETRATVALRLRGLPQGNRRDDSLGRGEAVAVTVGATVPRGADMVYPFDLLADPEGEAPADAAPLPEAEPEEPAAANGDEDYGSLPVAAPPRVWLLAERYREGQVEVPLLPERLEDTMVNYGGWSRSRDPVIAERTVLRAGELALLEALGVDEVTVYRRPVIGVACLEEPHREGRDPQEGAGRDLDPLLVLATQLVRSSRVAALPLAGAALKFRPLAKQVRRWLEQVDIMLLVGGSSSGHRCLGHDIVSALGEVSFAGMDLRPGANTSLGTVAGKPVVAIPGSLADVLTAYVLVVRPLAHRYLTPNQYSGTVELELERGARLRVEHDTAVPVRYGQNQDGDGLSTRFSGRVRDPWQDYIRGQALVVLEGGRQYADGERVTAHTY